MPQAHTPVSDTREAPRASIIIPIFNGENCVNDAINSSLIQTFQDLELLLVDDGSTDGTSAILSNWAQRDRRISVISHTNPLGPSAARNAALAVAKGAWIVLLDADDTMQPDRVERLLTEAEGRGLDLLADNLQLVDAASKLEVGIALDPDLMATDELIDVGGLLAADWPGRNVKYRSLGLAKPVIRRTFLTSSGVRYDENARLGEDLLFYCGLLCCGARFGLTSAALYRYRTNAESISNRAAPTTELIAVNDKIRTLVHASFLKPSAQLAKLLEDREAALRFQVLTWSIKKRMPHMAACMIRDLGLWKAGRLILERNRENATRRAKGNKRSTPLIRLPSS